MSEESTPRLCAGFGEFEGRCPRLPDAELNPSGICGRCETLRRRHITAQLEELSAGESQA
jgi:hypothetical protein